MVIIFVLIGLFGSCVPYRPPAPTMYVENIPQSVIGELTLEERMQAEEAWTFLKQGDGERAKKVLVRLGKASPLYYAGLGYALYLLEDIQTAEDFFKAALQFYPDLILIHVGLAQIYQETNREDSAFGELRSILKLDPDHAWAKPRYEDIKSRKTTESLGEAQAFSASGQTEKSKASYLKALFYSPTSVPAHSALAHIYREENNLASALVHLKAANTYDPENTEILQLYGEVLFDQQNYKESLKIYEKLNTILPDNSQIHERLEAIKNRLGIFDLPSQFDTIQDLEAITKENMAAVLGVKFKDILQDPSQKPPIIVDIATSWASKFILQTATLGLLDVYPNHEFQPQKVISRAEMAEILIRLIVLLEEKGYKFIQHIPIDRIKIADVTPSNFYYQPILTIVSYDIMALASDQTFKPDTPVSGQEAIKLLDIILALIQ